MWCVKWPHPPVNEEVMSSQMYLFISTAHISLSSRGPLERHLNQTNCWYNPFSSEMKSIEGSGTWLNCLIAWTIEVLLLPLLAAFPLPVCSTFDIVHVWLSDQQAPCRSALKDWLQIHGKEIYYDRLSRALQKIGRTDIAIGQPHTTTLTRMQCTTSLKPTCNL